MRRLMGLKACAVALALVSTAASAQSGSGSLLGFRDLNSTRAIALGGAFRSMGGTADAIVGNPAAVALWPVYRFDFGGAWDFDAKEAFGSAMVLDGRSTPVGGGAAYQLVSTGRGAARSTGHLTTIAFGGAWGSSLVLGGSTRYLVMSGASSANAVTADAGVILRLSEGFNVGFSGHNLIDTRNPELARYFTLSSAVILGALNLAVDAHGDFNGPSPEFGGSVGAEYLWEQAVPLRIGFRREPLLGNAVSGGLGFLTSEGSLDFAYQHALDGTGRLISLSLSMFVN